MAQPERGAPVPRQARLQRILHWGIPADMRPEQAKYIRFLNAIAVFLFFFVLVYLPVEWYLGLPISMGATGAYSASMGLCLWLNRRRHYAAARHCFCVASLAFLLVASLQAGPVSGVHFFFFTAPVAFQYLYPPQERLWRWVYSLLPGLAFFLVYVGFIHGFGGPALPPMMSMVFYGSTIVGIFWALIALSRYAHLTTEEAEAQLAVERGKSEALLLNILPPLIAERLRGQESTIAEGFAEVTVLFADIVGFTRISAGMAPQRVVDLLNSVFSAFDGLATERGLEKIKTIGDAYMVAGGLPDHRPDHAEAVADMALAMVEAVRAFRHDTGEPLSIRVGINTGPVVAGVIGKTKYIYDLWGDTVNTASRMESHGVPGEIQVTEATRRALGDRFVFLDRGEIEIKGKGLMPVFLLRGRANAPPPGQGQAVQPKVA
ncbi:MAG TPA: adenylate/guanylate cyclase domain-containing protein [bacterium]|nr:adenylate/guanylate cyclase domain-containing protein [bacterium]